VAREIGRHQQRADGGRGAQDAEPERAGLQDIVRIDRQQRGDAAEQHGEKIERDGAQDRRIVADEADSGIEIVRRRRILHRRLLQDADAAGQNHAQQQENAHDAIGQARHDGKGQTAERRPGDGRDLPGAARYRGRALQRALRGDQRQQRRGRRAFEGAGNPQHEGRDENLHLSDRTRKGAASQEQRGQCFDELAQLHDALALEAVGRVAGNKYQQRGGKKLHQPDHAEIEGAAGQVVDLPADRDRADLARKSRQAARPQEEQERSVREQIAGADRHHRGHERSGD
jgi:hypothetical protein